MSKSPLPRLPLSVLRPGGQGSAQSNPDLPAFLSRQNVRLNFATRDQVSKLKDVEVELLGANKLQQQQGQRQQQQALSVLRGAIVRFISQGRYRLDCVAGTALEESGQLVLKLQDFGKPVPIACLSNTNSLESEQAWEKSGHEELAGLVKTMAPHLPSCREVAATCCRLSLGWLWSRQAGAFQDALKEDPAGVAALLDDQAAVAALLPCIQEPRAASVHPRVASPRRPAQQPAVGAALAASPARAASLHKTAASPAAGASKAGIQHAPAPPPRSPQQQQQQQQQGRQAGQEATPPAAKRQRLSGDGGAGSGPASSPAGIAQAGVQRPGPAQQGSPAQQPQLPGPKSKQAKQQQQLVSNLTKDALALASQNARQLLALMPPGGMLESLMVQGLAVCDGKRPPGQAHQVGDLGNALQGLRSDWKKLASRLPTGETGRFGLRQLVWELHRRGLLQAELRSTARGDPNLYVRSMQSLAAARPAKRQKP